MALPLKSHLKVRAVALFIGFFGGFALFAAFVFGRHMDPGLAAFLFFGLLLGGAYFAQLAFAFASPAACPACGAASAVPEPGRPFLYACRACGAASNAAQSPPR